jgi:hypothetical protein
MGGAVSNVIDTVGDIGQGAIDAVSDIGVGIDQTVRDVLPGGWTTAALLTAGYYYAPEIGAYINASGSTVPVGGAVTAPVTSGTAASIGGYVSDAEQIAAMNGGAAATDMSLGQAGAANAAAGSTVPTALGDMAGTGAGGGTTSGGVGNVINNAGGGMNLSDFSSALNIASSVNSLTGGGVSSLLGGPGSISGSEAQKMADPFAPYRANLGQMYSGALQPGTGIDITKMPGYDQYTTGVLNPAMEASKRSAAASGLMYSGKESAALGDIAGRGYYGFMTDYLNRLAQGSGATQNPATAGGLGITQNAANQQAFSQGLGGLGQGIAGLYGSGSNPYQGGSNMSNLFSGSSNYSGGEGGYA